MRVLLFGTQFAYIIHRNEVKRKKGGDTNSYRLFFNTHLQLRSGIGPPAYWVT